MSDKKQYKGLTESQVLESRAKHGANVLTPPEKDPLWKQYLEKFGDPLIIILLIAGALSIAISCYEYYGLGAGGEVFFEPVGIFVAILLATGLAFYFELQADKEFSVLNQVNDDEMVEVVRGGNITQVPRKEIVVGDVVIFNTGEEVPADCELLESSHLCIDESTLTGEPQCEKSADPAEFNDEDAPETDEKKVTFPRNHVMKGTRVLEGHGVARVFAVGDHTEQGKTFEAAQIDNSVKTPLNEQLDGLGDLITKISYWIAGFIVAGRIMVYFYYGEDFSWAADWVHFATYVLQTLMIAVTLIVVAVPEGLPMAVTLSLAYSMRSMLKTNNLVRRMHACETMGATTVICTDKTGTLTQNQMRVYETQFYDNSQLDIIQEGIAVNSTAALDLSGEAPIVLGNPTEGALLLWLRDKGKDYAALKASAQVLEEIPFSTERKYMATVVNSAVTGKKMLYVKGAPEIVYTLCQKTAGGVSKADIDKQLLIYQNQAMRTLAFACQTLEDNEQGIAQVDVCDEEGAVISKSIQLEANRLTFLGIVAISDPVRDDVPAAVIECLNAGIAVKIVTGDTVGTAKEIGRQIGLWNDKLDGAKNIITGSELAALSDEALKMRVMDLKIIARARPLDKQRLVRALQANNQVVAVTGDGTNDAPALNAAHVGLSMGDGTSVAKEASDITIIDNSFSSIGKAVMWGRSLYQNIQRFLLFQLTVNVTACLLVLCGAFMGTESPLTVTQMLWINLIMDTFAAMALASLPPSQRVMADKPRNRKDFILNQNMMVNIVSVGGFFFIMLLALLYIFQHADVRCLTDFLSLQLGEKNEVTAYELTLLFTIFVMTHFFYLFCARAYETKRSALHFKGCNGLLTIAVIILAGQVLMVEVPGVQQFFNVVGLSLTDWVIIVVGSSFVLWVREGWSMAKRRLCSNK